MPDASSPPALPPLPPQPPGVPWPTASWARAEPDAEVDQRAIDATCDALFGDLAPDVTGETHALLCVHRGRLVLEHYGPDVNADTTLPSWSMAKSITHALVGILQREERLDIRATGLVPAWSADGDPRGAITVDVMLRMADGLRFVEDYVEEDVSSVIAMLFGAGKDDVAAYTEACPLAHDPDTVWSYSSGTTNVITGLLRRIVGGEPEMAHFMRSELFDRVGMASAKPRFDAAGTFIGSSFVFCTAEDFARFGLFYLRDGCWEEQRLLPKGWVDYARTPTAVSRGEYGAHWWLAQDGSGIFHASGYRGQFIAVDPTRDLVIVRLGASTPDQRGALFQRLRDLDRAFPLVSAAG